MATRKAQKIDRSQEKASRHAYPRWTYVTDSLDLAFDFSLRDLQTAHPTADVARAWLLVGNRMKKVMRDIAEQDDRVEVEVPSDEIDRLNA